MKLKAQVVIKLKTQVVIKLKKIQIVMKLKNLKCDKTQIVT